MCKPASMILTKDSVFWSANTDSHEDIIKEFNLNPDGTHGTNILRVEISPEKGNMSLPLDKWIWRYDQDTLPKWADKSIDEDRTRKALKDYASKRIILSGEIVSLDSGVFWVGGSAHINYVRGSARIESVSGSASVGSVSGSASVGNVSDSARVESVSGSASVGCVIGSARVGSVYGSARIGKIYASASVDSVYGSASVTVRSKSCYVSLEENAVLIDRSGPKHKVYIGKRVFGTKPTTRKEDK